MNLRGSIRPALYLAQGLISKGFEVSILSPKISADMKGHLSAMGIRSLELDKWFIFGKLQGYALWFEAWAREALFRLPSKSHNKGLFATVNFSHTLCIPSLFWYLQGPTFLALKDTEREFANTYRVGYRVLKPLFDYADKKLIKRTREKAIFLVANSHFCASLYLRMGIRVSQVIYPPINTRIFHPSTRNPSSNYVITYFGRETRFSVIKTLADLGITFKAFGYKQFAPKSLINHPNVDFLGEVPTRQLVHLYSNASFTLFPFTHEPFGYIPVESMACGTPVLTYNRQGPRESVINGFSGWLAKNDNDMINKALRIWNEGYPVTMRLNSIKVAEKFDKKFYVKKWMKTLALENP